MNWLLRYFQRIVFDGYPAKIFVHVNTHNICIGFEMRGNPSFDF